VLRKGLGVVVTVLPVAPYLEQSSRWPLSGRHILAHFDDESVDRLLALAVPSSYSPDRYEGADAWKAALGASDVRLQWDPDHDPSGGKLDRRAIQLGLRGSVLREYATTAIIDVIDMTPFVSEQRIHSAGGSWHALLTPEELVYRPLDAARCSGSPSARSTSGKMAGGDSCVAPAGAVTMSGPPRLMLTLLVLRCRDLPASRAFYEALGLAFRAEKHGAGPDHLSCQIGDIVLELYPATDASSSPERIGFAVPNVAAAEAAALANGGLAARPGLLIDPDGRKVELSVATAGSNLLSTWTVWRQDDNGDRFAISSGHGRAEADRLCLQFEQRGHKQTYWVAPDDEVDPQS
jgi:catechol 2,3-dioxygenase-like lactoylglutathione lyase family enzyme